MFWKYINFIILMALMVFAGCNNPKGGSSIAPNHTPLLQPPGSFSFTQIRSQNGDVSIRWSRSARASTYSLFQGTSPSTITTAIPSCSNSNPACTITGLDPNTVYYFSVVATNAAGSKNIDASGAALSVGTFDATFVGVGDGFIDLTWTNANNASSYNVIYGTSSGSYTSSVNNVTSPYRLSGLTNNVRHYVRVVAVNTQNGYGLSTSEISDTPFGPPSAPAGVTISATPGQMALTWNTASGAATYKVFRGTVSGTYSEIANGLTGTGYTDTTTTDGTSYFYVIKAFNGFDSANSAEVSARGISDFAVSSVVPGPGANEITVTWPATPGGATYDVYYGTNSSSLTTIATNATSPRTLTGLTGGVPYYVRVLARNTVGLGTTRFTTNQLSAVPVALLAAPAGFTATATPSQIQLNWNSVAGAASYELLRGTTSGTYTSLASGILATSYTDNTAVNGTAYYYVVRAFNGINGISSAERAAKPIAGFTISSVTPMSSSSLQVSWGAGAGADNYDVQYGTVSGTYTTTVSNVTSPYSITGLSANTIYYVVVRGRNAIGTGTNYITAQGSGLTKTAAPSGLVATSTSGVVTLDWADTAGASTYDVYRGTTSGSYAQIAGPIAASTYTDNTVTDGTSYFYVVTAFNGSESANSSEVSSRPISNLTLTSLTAASPTSLVVTWPATTGAATYDVRYGTSTGSYTTTLTNRTSPFTITGLGGGTTYYVQVIARNAVGTGSSENSNELSATTPVGPPIGVAATPATGQITISWTAMAGASSYKVYRGTVSGTYALLQGGIVTTNLVDNTVSAGTQYYYVVKSFNGSDSADSAEVTAKTIATFSITSVNALSTTSLQVTFPATAGGDLYDVRYGTATGSYTTTVSAVTSPYTITGLTANTNYFVVVRARNTIGLGASQTTPEVSIRTPVAAPTGLAAASTPGQVVLTWNSVTGATTYNVYRGTVSGTTTLLQSGVAAVTFTDTTPSNGTTYYYAVTADNGSESAKSPEVATQPIASHTITSVSSPTSTSINVTWGAVTGATAFDVLWGTTSGTYTGTALNQTSPYTITGLTANTNYFIVVRAKNTVGAGTTRNSTEISQKTITSTPTGLVATAASGQVGLNWTATTGATTYNVYRGTTSGSLALLGSAGTNAYLDTTVTNGTTYYYTISADNGSESLQSSEVSVRPIAAFTISSLVAVSSTSVNVTWGAAAGAATYDVRYGTSAGVYIGTVTGVTSPYTLTGLSPNTLYYIAVRANNSVGAGTTLHSNELTVTTATAAPTTLLATSADNGTASLTWTAASGATNYRIFRSTTSGSYGAALATGVTGTSYTDTTVSDGTTYYYVVRSFNGTESPNSNESSVQSIADFTVASTTAPTSTTIQVNWAATTGATLYDVRYGTTSGSYTTVSAVTSPYTITGLASGTNYFIVVRARNAIGGLASNQTPEVQQTTPVGPPTGLTATAAPGSVLLNWTAAGGASSYKIFRSTTSGTYGAALATGVTGTTYTDNTAANGTTYFYVIRSFNGADSADSNEATIRPIAAVTISSVTSPSSTSLQVTWGASAGAATYDVRYGTATGSYTTTLTNQTSPYTITGLTANTTYYIVVRANNAVGAGTSVTSSESSFKTATGAPVGLVASASPGQVGLNWTAVTGAASYTVYRGTTSGSLTSLATGVGTNAYLDTTVANGTTYFYAVTASNGSESAQSSEVSVRPIANFSISALTALSSTSLSITWGAAAGAATYDVRYGTSSGVYLGTVTGVTSPYTLTGLTANTQYFVVVRANNAIGSGTSHQTSELNATTSTAAPSTVVATATTGQIDLSWVAASGATNYRVYRGTTSGSYAQIAAGVTGTTYSDTTVVNGTQYYYSVRSFNGSESVDSNEATGKSIATFTVGSTNSPSSTSIQVNWTNPAGGDVADVRYGTSTGVYTTISTVTSPYTITGLAANTTYYIVVRARNTIGLGSSSQTAEVTQKTATAAPSGLAATATPGSVSLTWTATTGATNYNVYRSTTSGSYGAALATAVGTNAYTDATAANGTTYFYTVTSNNGSESAMSNEATIRPVASFSITSATTISTTQVDVTWPAVAGAAAYDLKYGTATGVYSTTLTNQTSPVSLTGLSPGSTYFIVVVARNAVGPGTSFQSPEVSAQTAFGAPGGVAVTATPGSAVVTWAAVSGAASYKIFRSTTSGTYGAALATGLTSPTYTDNTVSNGTTYYYVVRAVNSVPADSADSAEVSIQPISTFTFTSATPTSSSNINLVWTAATGATSYDVRYGTSTGSYTTTLTNQTSPLSVTGLAANTTYYFQVQAKNAVGTGATVNSSELSAKTATAAPSGLVATATTGQISLTWAVTTGATNYNVYRSTTTGSYGAALATAVAGTTYTDTTVTNGTTYFYVIRANNGIESANSNEHSGQSIASFALTSVTAPTTTTVVVTWPATAGAATYDVRYGTSTGSYSTTLTNRTSPFTITGLTSATTYYVVVRANNAVGSGSSAQTAELSVVTPLAAPSGLTATSSPSSVALAWTAVGGASSYKVYRSTTSGSYGAALATGVGTNSYTDATAVNGTTYFYVVKAFNGSDSADSNEATTRPIANFAITSTTSPSSTSIQVTWPSPAGGATYDVRYGTATGSYTTTVTGQTSPYTITGLTANTNYYIVIRANNAVGSGTSVSSSESVQKTATAAPTGLAALATPGSVALTWTAVTGATDYKIYRGTTSGSLALLASANVPASYTDNTVANGTTYYYAVVSNNGSDSAQSTEVAVQPISSFTFTSATVASASAINLVWTAATGATSYDVRYGTATGSYSSTVTGVTSPYSLNGLAPNTTYYISIRAKNAIGAGTNLDSSELSGKTATAAPSGLTATATTSQIVLNWTGVTGASSYNIYRGTTTGSYALLASPAGTGVSYTDSTAINGTTYFYAVTSTNGTESGYSNEASAQAIASFAITSVVAGSTTTLVVTWPATTGATAYDVRYGTSTGSYTTTVSSVASPYTITGLTSGSTYYVVVRARNAVGAGANIQSAEVSAVTPLAAPVGLVATSTPGNVNLNWTAVGGASGYRVYRSTTSGSGYSLIGSPGSNSYGDATAANGTTYYYVVRSFNGSESADSLEVSARPIANFAISLSGVSSTSIQVSWTNPTGGATYDVRYGTATGSYTTTVTGQTSPYTITGLTANTTYYVVVRANNAVGTGTSTTSTESNLKTATGAPTGLTATATPGSVGLDWADTTGATSYKVYRGTTSGSLALLASGVGTSSYTDNTVANGTTYYYAVLSNNGTDSAQSAEVAVQPIASFSLTAATPASSTSIDLTWGAAAGATAFDVRYGTSTGVYLFTVSNVSSSYTLTGLTAGTRYYISIRARNAVGAGTNFDSNEMNALTAVGAPSPVAAVATPGNVALTWGNVSGATNYNVYRSGSSGGPYTQIASAVAALTYNDTTVANGTTYYYVVRSFNGIESANSSEVAVKPIASFTLAAAVVNSASQITLSWGAAAGADSYDVRYGTSSGTYTTTVSSVTSSYAVTGLSAATLYYFAVRANNAVGAGTIRNSNEVSATTSTAAPTALAATAGTGTVNLTWTGASGATNYNVYRGTSSGVYSLLTSAVAATNYTDSTVVNGTTYYYVVRSFNGTESVNSNEATVTPIGSFSISATTSTTTTIQVTWGAAAGATAYDVRYGTTTGSYTTTVSGVTSSYTITGLTTNTTYYIIVRARNATGGTVNTAEVSQITALAAPAGLVATGGSGQVSLTWSAVSGASSYKVLRGTTSGSLTEIASGIVPTSYSDTTPSNGTTYFYAVRAFNGADSVTSSEVSKQPIATPVISSIVGNSTTSIQVTWAAATGAATYNVQFGTVSGTYGTTFTSVTSPYTITGLTAGTTYYVRLQAVNAIGGGTTVNSAESSSTPNSAPVLSIIADQTIEANNSLPVNFTLNDANHVLSCVGAMSGVSSNTTVLPNSGIVFSGSVPNCIVTLTPATNEIGNSDVTITANDGISTATRTFNFSTTACVVASIVWQQQPANITAGNTFATAPRLQLRKADGSACTTNFNPVSLEVTTDNSVQQDADIDVGLSSAVASGGVVTFTGTGMTRAGTAYTLAATVDGISSADSSTFNVTAGAASRIVFEQQPQTVPRNATMIPNPVVRVADTFGNYVNQNGLSITMSLIDNTEGATLGGTVTRSTNASGTATWTNLTVNTTGSYRLRATPASYAVIDSTPFDVLTLTPVNTVSVMENLQGPLVHPSGSVSYRRGAIGIGTNFIDGSSVTYFWEVVASNTSTASATIRLRRGNTSIVSQTIPASTTAPTMYTLSFTTPGTTSSNDIRLRVEGTTTTIHSSRIIAVQTGATKSQAYVPLTVIPATSATAYVNMNSTTAAALPDQNNMTFAWDPAKMARVDSIQLQFVYDSTGGSNCASLWNKTTNTQIGGEICGTGTVETPTQLAILPQLMPTVPAELEARVRVTASGTPGQIYKLGLLFRLVSIENTQNIRLLSHGETALTANKDYVTNRVISYAGDYGTGVLTSYVGCTVKANTSGAGTFVLKDHNANMTGVAGATNVSGSTINISNQATYTELQNVISTTDNDRMYLNYAHTSGSFSINNCLFMEEVAY